MLAESAAAAGHAAVVRHHVAVSASVQKSLGRVCDTSGISAQHVKRLRAVLAALATASVPSDMALPGLRLHPLRGDRAGQ